MANPTEQVMPPAASLNVLLLRLWKHISTRRQRQFGFPFILMILDSLAEIVSIGAVLPFLAVLTEPERIFTVPALQGLISGLEYTS
jgi:ATP-binding cassette, subfamily B, bacterial PglK